MNDPSGQAFASLQSGLSSPDALQPGLVPATAVGRLNLSRARIRQNMLDNLQSQDITRQRRASGASVHWLEILKSMPGGSVLIHAVNIWWTKQPLRAVAMAAAGAAKAVLQPVATRHPLALVLCAFALGGALAWSRPWKWFSKPIVLSGLLAPLLSKAISSMPSGIWTEAFNSMLRQPQNRKADSA